MVNNTGNQQKRTDKMLYKYRNLSNFTYQVIINSQLYMAKPSELNDPFDSQIKLSDSFLNYLNSLPEQKRESFNTRVGLIDGVKYTDYILRGLSNIDKRMESIGVLSFSKTDNSVLMWAHYAENHSGVCLGFEEEIISSKSKKDDSPTPLEKVTYRKRDPIEEHFRFKLKNNPHALPFEPDKDDKQLIHMKLTFKSLYWRYEDEYRYIRSSSGFYEFDKPSLKEVIFGLKTQQNTIETFMNLCRGLNYQVKFFKMELDQNLTLKKHVIL